VVTGQQQAAGRALRPEPGMGAAIEEEQLALAGAAGAPAAVLAAAEGPAVAQRRQPAAQGLIAEEDVVLLGEDVGEVGEVEVGIGRGGEVEDLLPQRVGGLVGRGACGVAVADGLGAVSPEAALEALDLAPGEAQGEGGIVGGDSAVEAVL